MGIFGINNVQKKCLHIGERQHFSASSPHERFELSPVVREAPDIWSGPKTVKRVYGARIGWESHRINLVHLCLRRRRRILSPELHLHHRHDNLCGELADEPTSQIRRNSSAVQYKRQLSQPQDLEFLYFLKCLQQTNHSNNVIIERLDEEMREKKGKQEDCVKSIFERRRAIEFHWLAWK